MKKVKGLRNGKILAAYYQGEADKLSRKPPMPPKGKYKRIAYINGYNHA